MQLSSLLSLLKRSRILLLVCAIAGGTLGIAWASRATKAYTATARVQVTVDQASTADSTAFDRIMATQVAMITSDAALKGAIPHLHLAPAPKPVVGLPAGPDARIKTIRAQLAVTRFGTTSYINITATAVTADNAVLIANTVARSSVAYAKTAAVAAQQQQATAVQTQLDEVASQLKVLDAQLAGPHSASVDNAAQTAEAQYATLTAQLQQITIDQASATGGVAVVQPATTATAVPSGAILHVLLGLILGLMLGFGIALAREQISDRIISADEAEHFNNLRLMSEIPESRSLRTHPEIVPIVDRTNSEFSAAIHRLRSGIDFSTLPRGPRVVSVVSPDNGDGRTTIAVNLAASYASIGRRVALITAADENRAIAGLRFAIRSDSGLVRFGSDDGAEVLFTRIPGLSLFPVEAIVAYPTNTDTMLIRFLEQNYDIAIIDVPAANHFTETRLLANALDHAVVLVNRSGTTSGKEARRIAETLDESGAHVLGVVLNHNRSGATASKAPAAQVAQSEKIDPPALVKPADERAQRKANRQAAAAPKPLPWDRYKAGSG